MAIEESIFSQASGYAGLTALISTNPCRFYLGLMQQDPAYPSCTYSQVSAPREALMGADPGIVHARYQVDCWDTTRIGARDLAKQVRACFQRWRGTVGGVVIFDTFIDDERDLPADLVSNVALHRRMVDLLIHYAE